MAGEINSLTKGERLITHNGKRENADFCGFYAIRLSYDKGG
jgi:hypothetical protein